MVAWLSGMMSPSMSLTPLARASASTVAHSNARLPSGSGEPARRASSSSWRVASPNSGQGWMHP